MQRPFSSLAKRFWKNTSTVPISPTQFNVLLDSKPVKTPLGQILTMDNKGLALLVQAEWDSAPKSMKPSSLPITSILVRSIDTVADQRQLIIKNMLAYLRTDTILYHASSPPALVALQSEHWTPLIDWLNEKFSVKVEPTTNLLSNTVSSQIICKFKSLLESLDDVQLAAFEKAVITSKSFIISLALMYKQIGVKTAALAARVEVESQIGKWGLVEDAHDVDEALVEVGLGAAAVVLMDHVHADFN